MSKWNQSPTAGHDTHGQSVVYTEDSGQTIAIVYDGAANARLIAAAPVMLKALQAIHQFWEAGDGYPQPLSAGALITDQDETIQEIVRAAIAQVEQSDLCPVCGEHIEITGKTKDGRLIGTCGDAFSKERWEVYP